MREASKTWILAIQAKHVKEVPLDPSLLAQGAKNYGTHRLRRRGLPTHVPKAWLGQHSAAASGLCSPVKSEVGNPITLISVWCSACRISSDVFREPTRQAHCIANEESLHMEFHACWRRDASMAYAMHSRLSSIASG